MHWTLMAKAFFHNKILASCSMYIIRNELRNFSFLLKNDEKILFDTTTFSTCSYFQQSLVNHAIFSSQCFINISCVVFFTRKVTNLPAVIAIRRRWTLMATMSISMSMGTPLSLAPPRSLGTGGAPTRSYSDTSADNAEQPRPRKGKRNSKVI